MNDIFITEYNLHRSLPPTISPPDGKYSDPPLILLSCLSQKLQKESMRQFEGRVHPIASRREKMGESCYNIIATPTRLIFLIKFVINGGNGLSALVVPSRPGGEVGSLLSCPVGLPSENTQSINSL